MKTNTFYTAHPSFRPCVALLPLSVVSLGASVETEWTVCGEPVATSSGHASLSLPIVTVTVLMAEIPKASVTVNWAV